MQYVNINDIFSKGTSCEGEEKEGSKIEILGRFQGLYGETRGEREVKIMKNKKVLL